MYPDENKNNSPLNKENSPASNANIPLPDSLKVSAQKPMIENGINSQNISSSNNDIDDGVIITVNDVVEDSIPKIPSTKIPDSLKVSSSNTADQIIIPENNRNNSETGNLNQKNTSSNFSEIDNSKIQNPVSNIINPNVKSSTSVEIKNEEPAMQPPMAIPVAKNPQDNIPTPLAPFTPKGPADSVLIRPLRTYEDDVKEAMQTQNASVARIVLSEQKKKEKENIIEQKSSIKSPVNIKKILIAFLFMIVGGGIAYGAYLWQTSRPVENRQALIRPPIIETDSQVEVVVGDRNKSEALESMEQTLDARFPVENVREIFLTKNLEVVTEKGVEYKKAALTTEDFFSFIGAIPPSRLTRSLNKEFLFGIYSLPEKNDPFLLFKVDDYENAFISMLEWEKTLARDITPIFYKSFGVVNPDNVPEESTETNMDETSNPSDSETATSSEISSGTASTSTISKNTSTSTISQISTSTNTTKETANIVELPSYDPRDFKDVVLNNRDTRLIKNSDGKTIFFYTFIDKTTLVMTTSNESLGEVIKRLRTARLIR